MNTRDDGKADGRVLTRATVKLRDIAAPKQIERVERRLFMKRGLSLGALALLTGCDISDNEAVDKVLWTMSRWNDRVQAALFNPDRLVQEYPASAITRPFPFNAYYGEDEIRVVDGSSYKLELAGMIRDRQAWTLPALHALPQVTQITRHICVEGWSAIGQWSGVPFRTFLERIGADTKAKYVAFKCADDYHTSIDMATALHPQTQLTLRYGGDILPAKYGFPMKLRVPTKLGFKNPKHIMAIEVTNTYPGGYWEDQGYNWFSGSYVASDASIRSRALLPALLSAALSAPAFPVVAQCVKQSPAHSVAVVELYTSEGCNSCPPADQWMSSIGRNGYSFDSVVPLAMHVDYWDDLGWKDRFASGRFTGRQNRLTDLGGGKVVYTPEVFVNTRELRSWESSARFSQSVAAVNATPARASIRLELDPPMDGRLAVRARFKLAEGVVADRAQAYVALYENRLKSDVRAGENRGVTLLHDHVVRQWIGPLVLTRGSAEIAQVLVLHKDAVLRNLGVAALVQDEARRDILQATAMAACLS